MESKTKLIEIMVTGICEVISGCEYFEDTADFCRVKCEWLREKLGLKLEDGTGSHDTYERVFGMTELGGNEAIQMVSAWADANRLVLGQVKVNDKTNEIKAVPDLLEILCLKGCIAAIDAMGCQKDISKNADYVLSSKENHPDMYNDVKFCFANEAAKKSTVTQNKGYRRVEIREYFLEANIDWLHNRDERTNLNAIGMVKPTVSEKDKVREETGYFITSLMSVDLFAKAVRALWGIESMHRCLDVVFHEDDCQVRGSNIAENFAVIRHIAAEYPQKFPCQDVPRPQTSKVPL
jgi:predicted transposase YbfD/YdcC